MNTDGRVYPASVLTPVQVSASTPVPTPTSKPASGALAAVRAISPDAAVAYAFGGNGEDGLLNMSYQSFGTAEDCRNALLYAAPAVQVIVTEQCVDVTPINLAAALCKDQPSRDVYLLVDQPTGSLSSRARAAGVRGLIDHGQAASLLGFTPASLGAGTPSSAFAHTACLMQANNGPIEPLVAQAAMPEPPEPSAPMMPEAALSLPLEPCLAQTVAQTAAPAPMPVAAAEAAPAAFLPLPQACDLATVAPATAPPLDVGIQPCPLPIEPTAAEIRDVIAQAMPMPTSGGQPDGHIYGFVSGRGGVGKSVLSLMSAVLAQRRGLRVALVDLDLQLGDLEYLAGSQEGSHIAVMDIPTLGSLSNLPIIHPGIICLLRAPSLPEMAEEVAQVVPALLHTLAGLADVVFVNTGSHWSELQALLANNCNMLLFCMDQRATSVRGCKQAVELCVRLGIPSTRFGYVLNRCSRQAPINEQDASLALGGVSVFAVQDGGSLVDELLSLGCPHELAGSSNALVASLNLLVDGLLESAHSGMLTAAQPGQAGEAAPERKSRFGPRKRGKRKRGA